MDENQTTDKDPDTLKKSNKEPTSSKTTTQSDSIPEASFSSLIMSLASASLMWMGYSNDPDKKIQKNKKLAMFNIDLLLIIKEKTKGNLSEDETKLLETMLSDLQMRCVNLQDEK